MASPGSITIKSKFHCSRLSAVLLLMMIFNSCNSGQAATRTLDREANIIYYKNKPANKQGDFFYEFQTTNGITTVGAGNANGHSGVVQYVSLEGIPITMTYVADANGYHPNGEHIPKTPFHVYKALEYIRTHDQVDEVKSRKF